MPGVTVTLVAPAAIDATAAHSSSFTRPMAGSAWPFVGAAEAR
jgi:hypothetical protein